MRNSTVDFYWLQQSGLQFKAPFAWLGVDAGHGLVLGWCDPISYLSLICCPAAGRCWECWLLLLLSGNHH